MRLAALALAALALAGPAARSRPRGALRRRVPARDGRPGPVRPARRRAAGLPLRRVRGPDRRCRRRHRPGPPARDAEAGRGDEAALSGPDRAAGAGGTGAAVDPALRGSGAARAARGRARRRRAEATARRRARRPAPPRVAPRPRVGRAHAGRPQAGARPPRGDARRGAARPERATRLAWARPEPEPDATLAIADEVAR